MTTKIISPKMKPHNRLWSRVDRRGPDDCWEWTAHCKSNGYGQISIHNKQLLTHRVAWEVTNGPIPDGLYVCHHCDNPPCCNPAHLFLGDQFDNMRDAREKGRKPPLNPPRERILQRLTPLDVRCVRHWLKDGRWNLREISEAFGVCNATISNIKAGRTWKRIDTR